MLNITFVYPDFENLGVEYLMAVCKEKGFNVNFIFYYADDPYTRVKKCVDYRRIAQNVINTKPDVVVFSCITDNYLHQLNCAREIKKISPKIFTVFGGIHVTAVWKRVISKEEVDCVSIGEGELSLPEFLLSCLENGGFSIPEKSFNGIVFKNGNRILGEPEKVSAAELDSIPFPEKDLFYQAMGFYPKEYYIITSRGCPYRCSYCYNSIFDNQKFRRRSVENVIEELVWAKKRFKIEYVHFCDDSFTTDFSWLERFCEVYKDKVNLPFLCSANPLLINHNVAKCLKQAGCVDVQIGVQSLSEKICRNILLRPLDKERIKYAITVLKEAGMMVQADHMLGIPDDTVEEEEKAIEFYNEVRPNLISVFWLTYYPGTKIIEIAKQKGLLTEKDVEKIEEGYALTEGNMHSGGSMKHPEKYYAVAFLLNYLPLLPKRAVNFLVKTGFYRVLKIKSYFLSTVIMRVILSFFDRRYFTGRGHILRFLKRLVTLA